VEREAIPWLLMKLSIQLYIAELSLSNTILFLDIFDVDRVRSTVHNWVCRNDLQRGFSRSSDNVAVGKL